MYSATQTLSVIALAALFARLVWPRRVHAAFGWQFPAFAGYCLFAAISSSFWRPTDPTRSAWLDGGLFALKTLAIIEVLHWASARWSPQARRLALLFAAAFVGAGALVWGSLPAADGWVNTYRQGRLWLGIGLPWAAGAGLGFIWVHGGIGQDLVLRRHAALLTIYLAGLGVAGSARLWLPRWTAVEWGWVASAQNLWCMAACIAWLWIFSRAAASVRA